MANENASGPLRIYNDGSVNDIWVGDDRLPTVGSATRDALGVGAPFTLVGTLAATTNYATLTLQVTDLEGTALAGRKKITVFPHDGSFSSVAATYTTAAKGVLLSTTTAKNLEYVTDANGALTTRLDTGAAVNNLACACFCGLVYGGAAAISVPG